VDQDLIALSVSRPGRRVCSGYRPWKSRSTCRASRAPGCDVRRRGRCRRASANERITWCLRTAAAGFIENHVRTSTVRPGNTGPRVAPGCRCPGRLKLEGWVLGGGVPLRVVLAPDRGKWAGDHARGWRAAKGVGRAPVVLQVTTLNGVPAGDWLCSCRLAGLRQPPPAASGARCGALRGAERRRHGGKRGKKRGKKLGRGPGEKRCAGGSL